MSVFLMESNKLLDTYGNWIERSMDKIDEAQLWARMRQDTNSIGNLCLHLAGNE
ncbi:DUF1572 family protein [Paenibacillus sp. J5C_2022]|uniref:DUF1572 family protein n=1 Tax=Paenibacillus sp. J5C2022 TaxID=2977129 RepID=UPI0021D370E4|nr:DUF1572 family protein [Paenibacillus sp. J5C2022]MCU6708229.1 DUF1572 family protein [Paenibacillus sp. J5C2022]